MATSVVRNYVDVVTPFSAAEGASHFILLLVAAMSQQGFESRYFTPWSWLMS